MPAGMSHGRTSTAFGELGQIKLRQHAGSVPDERADAQPHGFAFVVTPANVVLGRLRRSALDASGNATAEELMEAGPSTIRADAALAPLAERMRRHDLTGVPVATPEGVLLGVVRRDDLEQELSASSST